MRKIHVKSRSRTRQTRRTNCHAVLQLAELSSLLPSHLASMTTNGLPVSVPDLFLRPPLLNNDLETQTTQAQVETLDECLPLLGAINNPTRSPFEFNDFGVPELRTEDHIDFLHQNLAQFPAQFVGIDASRPWMVYWALLSLHLLGQDVSVMQDR